MGNNHRGKPRFKPGKPQGAPSPVARKPFNERRRMFGIIDGELKVAAEGDGRYHRSWFTDEGWMTASDPEGVYEKSPRGFSDARGLFVYKGRDFNHFVWHDLDVDLLDGLKEALGLTEESKVWFGAVPTADDSMDGRLLAGTVGELREQFAARAARANGPS